MKLESANDVHNLDQDEFDKLTPEQIREMAGSAQEDQEGQPEDQEYDDTQEESSEDGEEDGTSDEDQSEDDDQDQNPDDQDSTEDDEGDDETLDADEDTAKGTSGKPVKTKQGKSPAEDKTSQEQQQTEEVDHKSFYERVTAKFKAAGTELAVTNPDDIISLMQKGLDYTKKAQALSHLRGLDAVLRENGLTDPAELGYLIDLKNHKPEAIARLIQESGLDAFDLDEEKAAKYQANEINIEEKAKAVNVKEIVEANEQDPNFQEVFNSARTWDDASQHEIVANPNLLLTLAEHKRNGAYDRIMAELQNERLVRGNVHEPMLQQYVRIGYAMFGDNQNGGSAQVPNTGLNQQANKQRVVVKTSKNITEQRKRVAPPANSVKTKRAPRVQSPIDIYNLSQEDFSKLSPEILRNLK